MVPTSIDQELCEGCGSCIQVCPSETITLIEKKAFVTGENCLVCGHCEAACNSQAIHVSGLDPDLQQFANFTTKGSWDPHGNFDTGVLINLMRSRRSCRNFKERPVDRSLLEDLVKIGVTAPSGSNCQMWTFTIVPDRPSVIDFSDQIRNFFKSLNKKAEQAWLRALLSMLGKKELEWYYNNYYQKVRDKIKEWDQNRIDQLFHGAPAVIVVGGNKNASCPAEDALLATQNIILGAHSLGLGTCLIGFAVTAMKRDLKIKQYLGIPNREKVYAVIAVGHPNEKYQHLTGRKSITKRYFEVGQTAS